VAVHEVLVDAAGELFPQVVRGYALEAVDQRGDRESGRVVHEQVDVVGFAVELAKFSAHLRAQVPHDLLARGEHLAVEDVPPVLRDEDKMDTEVIDNTATPTDIRIWCPAWRQ
jgi:hypothetical protein